MQSQSDTLTTGVGNLVDADVARESANLTALQTKQQLGVQALSIANQNAASPAQPVPELSRARLRPEARGDRLDHRRPGAVRGLTE